MLIYLLNVKYSTDKSYINICENILKNYKITEDYGYFEPRTADDFPLSIQV
jgi:hypothetical protein